MRFWIKKLGLLTSMGSILDLSGTYFVKIDLSKLSINADTDSLYSDWEKIGDDFNKAENIVLDENGKQ